MFPTSRVRESASTRAARRRGLDDAEAIYKLADERLGAHEWAVGSYSISESRQALRTHDGAAGGAEGDRDRVRARVSPAGVGLRLPAHLWELARHMIAKDPMLRPLSRTWYLVRHGETEWNAIARMQGQLDSRLTALGREHASMSGRLLARLGVDAVFASPLGRVRETLAILGEHVTVTPVFDDRLMEWSAGAWSGELYSDLPHRWPDEWAAWTADRYHQRAPGGENFADLADRARSFVEAANRAPGERVAVVAHGFLNRALAEVLLGLSPVETMQIRQANDIVIRIAVTDGVPSVDHFVGGVGPAGGLPMAAVREST